MIVRVALERDVNACALRVFFYHFQSYCCVPRTPSDGIRDVHRIYMMAISEIRLKKPHVVNTPMLDSLINAASSITSPGSPNWQVWKSRLMCALR